MPRDTGQSDYTQSPQDVSRVTGEEEGDRLLRLAHVFSSIFREVVDSQLDAPDRPVRLNARQAGLLRLMAGRQSLCVREVARVLGMTSPAATRNIDKLEGLGLIERHPEESDRRTRSFLLSPRGYAYIGALDRATAQRFARAIEGLRPEELSQLSELLARMTVSLYQAGDASAQCCLRCAAHLSSDCPIAGLHHGCLLERPFGVSRASGKRGQATVRN